MELEVGEDDISRIAPTTASRHAASRPRGLFFQDPDPRFHICSVKSVTLVQVPDNLVPSIPVRILVAPGRRDERLAGDLP